MGFLDRLLAREEGGGRTARSAFTRVPRAGGQRGFSPLSPGQFLVGDPRHQLGRPPTNLLGAIMLKSNETSEGRDIWTKIAGIGFHRGAKEKIANVGVGFHHVTLRREPDNKYDDKAVQVLIDGMVVGYVPRSENSLIAALLDDDKTVLAAIEGETLTLRIGEVPDVRDDDTAA